MKTVCPECGQERTGECLWCGQPAKEILKSIGYLLFGVPVLGFMFGGMVGVGLYSARLFVVWGAALGMDYDSAAFSALAVPALLGTVVGLFVALFVSGDEGLSQLKKAFRGKGK